MKKNLISILILALLVVNVVLTAIMMFSVMGAAKKTSKLVTEISTALNLELSGNEGTEGPAAITIADLESVDIADQLTIPLAIGDDGKTHYCVVKVTFYLNKTSEDYETMAPVFTANTSLNKSVVNTVIGKYTYDEAQRSTDAMKNAILTAIRNEYGSDFIYRVEFSDILFS